MVKWVSKKHQASILWRSTHTITTATTHVYIFTGYWIALDDQNVEGDFIWTLTGQQPTYTQWSDIQPDDHLNIEDCVVTKIQGGWEDRHCNSQHYALCEYEN